MIFPSGLRALAEERLHERGHAVPLSLLRGMLPTPRGCDFVEAGPPIVLGECPARPYKATLLEAGRAAMAYPWSGPTVASV
jgi:hypothetical protein